MTPERWRQVEELYFAALEREAGERTALLDAGCGSDAELRREVEALLAAHEQARDTFLAKPALEVAARAAAADQSPSIVGQRLGHHQVLSLLGVGGMGEVYLAQDTRLGRKVALKMLPAPLTQDQERVARFKQEARAAAHLSHPNVCVVYDVGETHDGRYFIAMEYVGGVTLRERLAQGRLDASDALAVARQIAKALSAAHEAGVVHRDIKPENIVLRPDGYVKVLDFGLAKLTEAVNERPAGDSRAPTTFLARTEPGVMMGTASYMSPEQARGQTVDHRSDIFSFGTVLYEMLAGERAFARDSAVETMHAIIHDAPRKLSGSGSRIVAGLERVMWRCLEKEPERRYQSAGDVVLALDELPVSTNERAQAAAFIGRRPRGPGRAALLLGATFVVALAVGGAARALLFHPAPKTGSNLAPQGALPPMKIVPVTSLSGREEWPAFSPDGRQLAFMWSGEAGDNFDIYVNLIGAGAPLRLTTHPGIDSSPVWSPDGRYVAFVRSDQGENAIFRVPALGGPERKVVSLGPGAGWHGWYRHVVWSPDGKYLAFPDKKTREEIPSIFLLSLETLEARRLTVPPPQYIGDWCPAFSPAGDALAFIRWSSEGTGDVYVVPVDGGEPSRLTFDSAWIAGLAWTPDGGSVVFSSFRAGSLRLWKIVASGGTPEALALSGGENFGMAFPFSLSPQGDRLAFVQSRDDTNIWRIDLHDSSGRPTSPAPIISSTQYDGAPHVSPDGSKVVFQSERSGSAEIWMCASDGSAPTQLTFMGGNLAGTPRWSPDGRHVAFDARPEGHSDIYVVDVEGAAPRRVTSEPSNDVVPSWSQDGRWIYFASNRAGGQQIWKVPAEGGEPVQVTTNGGFAPLESPDGRFVYYAKLDDPGVWRVSVKGGEEIPVFDRPGAGDWGHWTIGQDGIYFINLETRPRPAVELFSFTTRRVTRVAVLEKEPDRGPPALAVSPDGRWLFCNQADQSGSDIMLAENFR